MELLIENDVSLISTASSTAVNRLQEVTLDLISTSSCAELYPDYTITENMVCTLTTNKDACQVRW